MNENYTQIVTRLLDELREHLLSRARALHSDREAQRDLLERADECAIVIPMLEKIGQRGGPKKDCRTCRFMEISAYGAQCSLKRDKLSSQCADYSKYESVDISWELWKYPAPR